MRLKKMEIIGFKSFGERSAIAFPPGISAIVGPNGCGKSNIVDALRWAMGEMSVKQLRGKSMEDIIFAGANGRPPTNLAEVSLTLSNENGAGPEALKDFTEVMLTRKLYRSGESLYMINRQPCRLKDIHNIFLGSGMGAKSYAVIQQGNIGAITDAGPEERRFFIEEAAGITRYKQRKKETLRKLEITRQNLVRVLDIIAEVDTQMKGLDRQAKKAEQYRRYREQIRILDLRLALDRHGRYSEAARQNERLLAELKDADIESAARLNRLDAAVEEIKLRRARKNQEISRQRSDKFELQRRMDRAEGDIGHRKGEIERLIQEAENLRHLHGELEAKNQRMDGERAEVEGRNQALSEEIARTVDALEEEKKASEAVRSRLAELRAEAELSRKRLMAAAGEEAKVRSLQQNGVHNQDQLKRRLRKVDEEEALATAALKGIEARVSGIRTRVARCRGDAEVCESRIRRIRQDIDAENLRLADQVKRVRILEDDRNQSRSRHAALKRMADTYEGYRDGVKAVMKDADPSEVYGLVADILEPARDAIPAVEAALGEALQYVLVKDPEAGRAAIDRLRTGGGGRSGFVPVSAVRDKARAGGEPDPGLLLNRLTVKAGFEGVARTLLDNVVLVDSLDAALERYCRNGCEAAFVTREGDLVSSRGVMIGGSPENLSGILLKKQELKALGERLRSQEAAVETEKSLQGEIEARIRDLEQALAEETEEKNGVLEEEREAEKALIQASEELKHAARTLETLRSEQARLLGESDEIDGEIDRCGAALARIEGEVQAAQAEAAAIDRGISGISSDAEASEARIVEIKLRLTARKAEFENGLQTARRLREFQADGRTRLSHLLKDIEAKERKRREAKSSMAELEASLLGMYERIRVMEEALRSSEGDYEEIEALLRKHGEAISEVQARREEGMRKLRTVEVDLSQCRIQREAIEAQVEERYHRPLDAFRKELGESPVGSGMSEDDLVRELAELRKKLERIGDVHLGAIEEYKALTERHHFLTAQQEDLVKAVDDLHKVIRKINRISQEKFLETFGKINEKLEEVFPRLFSGGSARLTLTEPGDPLETGVEFMVHPPGKKLTRLSLLSGGEKALSAIAFVFSIFLIKPASFCIMDEIDAPLDEANVCRFNELLKIIGETSQIIMITHKKKSMEFADTLFGITMEQKGVSRVVSVNFEGGAGSAASI